MRIPLLLVCLALASCNRLDKPSPEIGQTAPTSPPVHCQPTVKAPSRAEPTPPETGLTSAVLFDMVVGAIGEEPAKAWWKWFTVDHPEWGREGWVRIDKARGQPPCVG